MIYLHWGHYLQFTDHDKTGQGITHIPTCTHKHTASLHPKLCAVLSFLPRVYQAAWSEMLARPLHAYTHTEDTQTEKWSDRLRYKYY